MIKEDDLVIVATLVGIFNICTTLQNYSNSWTFSHFITLQLQTLLKFTWISYATPSDSIDMLERKPFPNKNLKVVASLIHPSVYERVQIPCRKISGRDSNPWPPYCKAAVLCLIQFSTVQFTSVQNYFYHPKGKFNVIAWNPVQSTDFTTHPISKK